MTRTKLLTAFCLAAGLVKADVYPVIIIGHVKMEDGAAPPFVVSIQRECSDQFGDAPGPLTDKKGQWVWRLDIDLYAQRSCFFLAHHDGYTSTRIDASNINKNYLDKTVYVPDIVMSPSIPDPYTIHTSGDNFPGKSRGPFLKAMKALDAHNMDEAIKDLQEAVNGAPKFADGWHALGVVYEKSGKRPEARDAYNKAIDADPKNLQSYVNLARLCLQIRDWQCAADAAEREIRTDTKRLYPEIYLHEAAARFELKDLAGAEKSADELIRLDPKSTKYPRIEYVLGRISEAKGDINGAREHMMKYLSLDAVSKDAEQVQAHMLTLGKTDGAKVDPPDLELL
jgi:tetratricopeptide (TPR) repeat protein